jgi:hypothetical protein
MGHRYFELPFSGVDIAGVDAQLVWVRSGVGVAAFGIDHATGEVRHSLKFPSTLLVDRRIHVSQGFAAANVERSEVSCIALSTEIQAWRRQGEVRGTTPAGFVLAERNSEGGARLVEVTPDGKAKALVEVPDAKYALPGAVVTARHVWTVSKKKLLGVPLDGGAPRTFKVASKNAALLPFRGGVLLLETLEETTGTRTRLSAVNDTLVELGALAGETFAAISAASDGLVVSIASDEGEPWECVAASAEKLAEPLRLTVPARLPAAASGSVAAIAQHGALALLSAQGGAPCCVRIPIPTGSLPSVGVGPSVACVAVSKQLFVVDLAQVQWAPGSSAQSVAFLPAVGSGVAASAPAPAGGGFMRSFLDGMRGKKAAEGGAVAGSIALDVAGLPPAHVDAASRPQENLIQLERASERLGFAIPPALEALLSENDRDPQFRRWLDQLSILIEVSGFSTAWEGADPCMIGLAGNGGGDVVGLYFYPPAHSKGASLPVVDWWHETNEVAWLAKDFDTWLAGRLAEAKGDDPEIAALVMERLGLGTPTSSSEEGPPPAWFLAAHGEGKANADDLARLMESKPVEAERLAVRRLRDDAEDDETAALLRKLYTQLGWTWHLENLERGGS